MQASNPIPVALTASTEAIQGRKTVPSGLKSGAVSDVVAVTSAIELIAKEMALAETELHNQLKSTVNVVSEINDYLCSAGGKRLRPLITGLGARAAGLEGSIERLMCVGELLHLGSLLHDDVVDEGAERRGRPAAQRVYGNPAAVLSGDVCLARSIRLAAEEAGPIAVQRLSDAVVGMAEGEVLQMSHIGDLQLGLDGYMDIIERKSARLIAWCAAAGAWKNKDNEKAEILVRYGTKIGIAFQITDDVLDYTGNKRLTGKRRGQDLWEGKLTLPLVLAMDRRPELRTRLERGIPSPERIPALIEEVCNTGGPADALEMARGHVQESTNALKELDESPWRNALEGIAHYLVDRIS